MTKELVDRLRWIVNSKNMNSLTMAAEVMNKLSDIVTALEAATPQRQRRWRHKKTGDTYVEVGRGKMQSDDLVLLNHDYTGEITHDDYLSYVSVRIGRCGDMLDVVTYRSEKDGKLWTRPTYEFEDGRFEEIT